MTINSKQQDELQELLEHQSSKTTEIYTHVSNHKLCQIRNPLDDMNTI